jgi:hypothetical protein
MAILLRKTVLKAIASIGFGIREVLRTVEFNGNSEGAVDEVDLHLALPVEWDGNANVQLEIE